MKKVSARTGYKKTAPDDLLTDAFARIDPLALGLAVGIVAGTVILTATAILLLKGGAVVGPHLVLLEQYIPGYSVSWTGGLMGWLGGFSAGFIAGWAVAFLRNLFILLYLYGCAFWARLDRFLDDA
jgi:hypothetical protein